MKKCLICERDYDGTQHMGLEACRACSAFYRRCITSNKIKFVCRRRSNNCILNTSRKEMCQKCRFDKCKQVGLEVGYASRLRHGHHQASTASSNSSSTSSPIQWPNVIAHENISSNISCLTRINNSYQKLCERRLSSERILITVSSVSKSIENETYYAMSANHISETIHAQVPSIIEFLSESFDEFASCNMEEKLLILQPTLCEFWMFDTLIRTSHLWIKQISYPDIKNFFFLSMMYYVDMDNLVTLFDSKALAQKDSNEVLGIAERWLVQQKNFIEELIAFNLTSEETLSLYGLLFFSRITNLHSSKLQNLAEGVRTNICNSLHDLLVNNSPKGNYAKRMYDLLSILIKTKSLSDRVKEDVHLLTLFNFFEESTFLTSLVRCNS
ncbi:unnamed protein product [Auanema sp. JU1783]|nr:unnamed protein product [Auanema sp. JU1783]